MLWLLFFIGRNFANVFFFWQYCVLSILLDGHGFVFRVTTMFVFFFLHYDIPMPWAWHFFLDTFSHYILSKYVGYMVIILKCYTLRFYFHYLSLLAQPVNIVVYYIRFYFTVFLLVSSNTRDIPFSNILISKKQFLCNKKTYCVLVPRNFIPWFCTRVQYDYLLHRNFAFC